MMVLMAGCSGAASDGASESSESDLKKTGKGMSLASFEKAMNETQQWADNDPCSFKVTKKGRGLELVLTAEGKTAKMEIASSDTISFSEKVDDGSTQTYRIAGVGEIVVINADDAFESIEIAPKGGASVTCEIDF